MDQLQVSVLQRCPSYRESNKGSKERRGPTLGVRFTEDVRLIESQIKAVKKNGDQLQVSAEVCVKRESTVHTKSHFEKEA